MTSIIVAAALSGYAAAWLACARRLFRAWRPLRVPACQPPCAGRHDFTCYRQRRADLTTVDIDKDVEATALAALAALFWWALAAGRLITWRAPELEHEKKARLARLDADIAAREKELAVAEGSTE
jgi:hypothetical protein